MDKLMIAPAAPSGNIRGQESVSLKESGESGGFARLLQQKTETQALEGEAQKAPQESGGREEAAQAQKESGLQMALQLGAGGAFAWQPENLLAGVFSPQEADGAVPVPMGDLQAVQGNTELPLPAGTSPAAPQGESADYGMDLADAAGESGQDPLPAPDVRGEASAEASDAAPAFSVGKASPSQEREGSSSRDQEAYPEAEQEAMPAQAFASAPEASRGTELSAAAPEVLRQAAAPAASAADMSFQGVRSLPVTEESLPEDVGRFLADRLTGKPQTLEITLEPASLGKLTIRAVYEEGHATVSIMASDPKTLEILHQRAAELAEIVEDRTGQTTLVYTQGLYQEQGDQLPYGEQERKRREEPQKKRQRQASDTFAQQLRLGLV